MHRSIGVLVVTAVAGMLATAASAQTYGTPNLSTSTSASGPSFSARYFTTPLENDASRVVQMQQQLHLPNRPGNAFHTHNGDQWEVVIEGEITFTVKGQPPKVLKTGESVYIPRGTIHRNENKGNVPARTIELLVMDKDKPQSNPVPTD